MTAEVWCDKCVEPAEHRIVLTTGEIVYRCGLHAWLLRQPQRRPRRK